MLKRIICTAAMVGLIASAGVNAERVATTDFNLEEGAGLGFDFGALIKTGLGIVTSLLSKGTPPEAAHKAAEAAMGEMLKKVPVDELDAAKPSENSLANEVNLLEANASAFSFGDFLTKAVSVVKAVAPIAMSLLAKGQAPDKAIDNAIAQTDTEEVPAPAAPANK